MYKYIYIHTYTATLSLFPRLFLDLYVAARAPLRNSQSQIDLNQGFRQHLTGCGCNIVGPDGQFPGHKLTFSS